jgi:oligosaccharide repeat unit polymerase
MFFSLLLFLFSLYIFIRIEKKYFNWSFYSPVVLLGAPLFLLALFINIIGPFLGFITVNSKALYILLLGLFSFWLGGMFISFSCHLHSFSTDRFCFVKMNNRFPSVFFILTSIIIVSFLLYDLKKSVGIHSLFLIEDKDLTQNGLIGHLRGFAIIFIMFFVVNIWEKKLNIYFSTLIFIFLTILMMLSGVRGNVMIPFIGAMIYLLLKKYLILTPKSIFFCAISIIGIFIIPTLFFTKTIDDFEYVCLYFIFYLTAGVLGFSSYLDSNALFEINPEFIYAFFINLYKKLFLNGENYVSLIANNFMPVTTSDSNYIFTSNVYTLIGEIYINSGYFSGTIFLFIFGGYVYYLYSTACKSIVLSLLYSYVGACLVLGIFSQYIFTPIFIENQLLLSFMYFVSKIKTGRCNF